MTAASSRHAIARRTGYVAAAALAVLGPWPAHAAPTLPEIRLSQRNAVPACVTPERLMRFLKQRNGDLSPRFRNIASFYKTHGEAWGVRWDYAFFQMAIETNFLTYRAPSGRMGDVDPKQNNFAGIGTTGGGVPGDSFPDVSTGVLGQIQHLVVYSGETIPNPVAPRTQLKQEHILAKSRELNRPVRFSDLAGRWAADRKYGGSIEWVAERFRAENCKGRAPPPQETDVLPWQQKDRADGRGRATAPAPKGAVHADAGSAVRTIWSKEEQRAIPKTAARAPVKPADAVKPSDAVKLGEVPAQQPVRPAEEDGPPVALVAPVDAPEAHFALFTPPAGLAAAKIPAAGDGVTPSDRTSSETEAAPPSATGSQTAAVPLAAEADTAPAEAPRAVSGNTVAGFLIGGPAKSDFVPPSGLGVKPGRCVIETARYGGETTVLVKAQEGTDAHYVALSVLDGFEDSMTKSFLASRAEGGEVVGTFPSRDAALAKARTLCPD
jgi:hypothetical protein